VPDDLAIVGFGGIEMGQYTVPALSTMDHAREALGREAVGTLLTLLDGGTPDELDRVLPATLLVRESCGAGRGAPPVPAR